MSIKSNSCAITLPAPHNAPVTPELLSTVHEKSVPAGVEVSTIFVVALLQTVPPFMSSTTGMARIVTVVSAKKIKGHKELPVMV
jgi:hypothetical protein